MSFVHTHTQTHMYIYIYIYMYIYVYIFDYMYLYIYRHINVCIWFFSYSYSHLKKSLSSFLIYLKCNLSLKLARCFLIPSSSSSKWINYTLYPLWCFLMCIALFTEKRAPNYKKLDSERRKSRCKVWKILPDWGLKEQIPTTAIVGAGV